MAATPPRTDAEREELARRGDAAYKKYVKPQLTPADHGKLVAIDVHTGEYEIDGDKLSAVHRLRDRLPDASVWMVRVGSPWVDRLGWGVGRPSSA